MLLKILYGETFTREDLLGPRVTWPAECGITDENRNEYFPLPVNRYIVPQRKVTK